MRVGRARDASGFMLIELLVVVLIIGVLAAILLPSFLGQKGKALDAQAKALARSAETTAETLAVENDGVYEKVSPAELNRLEPAIDIAPTATKAYLSAASGSRSEYTITTKSTNGDEFTVTRKASGEIVRACASPIAKSCSGGESGTW